MNNYHENTVRGTDYVEIGPAYRRREAASKHGLPGYLFVAEDDFDAVTAIVPSVSTASGTTRTVNTGSPRLRRAGTLMAELNQDGCR